MSERLDEFWSILAEIARYKTSKRVENILAKSASRGNVNLILKSKILSPEVSKAIEDKYNLKSKGQSAATKLKNNWSFGAIMAIMDDVKKYDRPKAFFSEEVRDAWVLASNVAHGDAVGLNFISAREARNEDTKGAFDFMHAMKLMRAGSGYSIWMVLLLVDYLKIPGISDAIRAETRVNRNQAQAMYEKILSTVEAYPTYDHIRDKS